MSSQTSEPEHKNRAKVQSPVVETKPEVAPDLAPATSELGSVAQSGSITAQASMLKRMPSAQGQNMVTRMNRVQGNQHVQNVMKAMRKNSSPVAHPRVQTSMTVSTPGDAYELEADQVAEQVMTMTSTPAAPPQDGGADDPNTPPAIRRYVQRATQEDVGGKQVDAGMDDKISQATRSGSPLPSGEKQFFESRMGVDLSNVTVHTDDQASQTAQDLSARAYTVGSSIAFNKGEYKPGTTDGRRLLAHELTHVVQQGGAGAKPAAQTKRIARAEQEPGAISPEEALKQAQSEVTEGDISAVGDVPLPDAAPALAGENSEDAAAYGMSADAGIKTNDNAPAPEKEAAPQKEAPKSSAPAQDTAPAPATDAAAPATPQKEEPVAGAAPTAVGEQATAGSAPTAASEPATAGAAPAAEQQSGAPAAKPPVDETKAVGVTPEQAATAGDPAAAHAPVAEPAKTAGDVAQDPKAAADKTGPAPTEETKTPAAQEAEKATDQKAAAPDKANAGAGKTDATAAPEKQAKTEPAGAEKLENQAPGTDPASETAQPEAAAPTSEAAAPTASQPEAATSAPAAMGGDGASTASPETAQDVATSQIKRMVARMLARQTGTGIQRTALPGAAAPVAGAPATFAEDPKAMGVADRIKGVAVKEQTHESADHEAKESQAAAKDDDTRDMLAQDKKVGEIAAQKPGKFNPDSFIDQLMEKVSGSMPKTLDEAQKFDGNRLNEAKSSVSGMVKQEQENAAGPIEEEAQEAPDKSAIPDKAEPPIPQAEAGPAANDVGAQDAAPKSQSEAAVEGPMQESSAQLDQQMAENNVTEEQLEKSNEPQFQSALDEKDKAQTNADEAPKEYRAQEQTAIQGAETQAQSEAAQQTDQMHSERENLLNEVMGDQEAGKGVDEGKRREIATHIANLYEQTKKEVDGILGGLDGWVEQSFEAGANAARDRFKEDSKRRLQEYKDERYSGLDGAARWIGDLFTGLPPEVEGIYREAASAYLDDMRNNVLRQIAVHVTDELNRATEAVAQGRQKIQTYVATLDPELQKVGQQCAQNIQGRFDQLESDIEDKQNTLIDNLSMQYAEAMKEIEAELDAMREENAGLVSKAMGAIQGVIDTIIELKNMLMGMLANAISAIEAIIKDPIQFGKNLFSAIGMGIKNFASNIGKHLQTGLISWLTGALGSVGLQMPESFDLKGILSLVLQILGLTWDNIRAQIIKGLDAKLGEGKGEMIMKVLETAWEVIQIIRTQGLGGLWEFIKEKIGDLKAMVMDKIKDMIITQVIQAGVQWLIGILGGPAGAFVKAVQAIIGLVQWFMQNASRLVGLVNAVSNGIVQIAAGNLSGAANLVENALATSIPMVLSLFANLLGLGSLTTKVQGIFQAIRAPINSAIQWVVKQAVTLGGKLLAKLGIGGNKDGEDDDRSRKVKDKAKTMVAARTKQPFKNEEELQSAIQGIETQLKPEGLKSLTAKPDGKTGRYDIVAMASPEEDVGDAVVGDSAGLTGAAKAKYDQIMGDDHAPSDLRAKFADEVKKKLETAEPDADQLQILKDIISGGDYMAKGPAIPADELKAKGGMTRTIPLKTIWEDNLEASYKAKFGSFEAWLSELAKDKSAFNPGSHLNMGSTIPGKYATAWWAPRGEQKGNTMAELIEELALNPATYPGGCVRATVGPEAAAMAGFKKPTGFDGIYFKEWVPAPSSPWGITGGGSLEGVAPKIALSQATQLEFLPGDMSGAMNSDKAGALTEAEKILSKGDATPGSVQNQLPALKTDFGLATVPQLRTDGDKHFVQLAEETNRHKLDGNIEEVIEKIGGIQIMVGGDNYYIRSADASQLVSLLQEVSDVQVRNLPKGITVYRKGAQWYFEKNDDVFEHADELNNGEKPAEGNKDLQPNAAFVELHGYEGLRSINGVKLPNSKQLPGGKSYYELTDEEAKQHLPKGISFEQWQKAVRYVQQDFLAYAGHVGVSLDGGNKIYGFTPIRPEAMPMKTFLGELGRNQSFPGSVKDDTAHFHLANKIAQDLSANTNVIVVPMRVTNERSLELIKQLQGMESQKNGEHGKRYSFPYQDSDPRSEGGTKHYENENTANCAAFPGLIGVPIPVKSGQIRDYIPAMKEWVKSAPDIS